MKVISLQGKMLWVFTSIALLSAVAWGQETRAIHSPASIQVSAEATVTAKPDRAELDIGVLTQAPTAQAAGARNAEQLAAVLGELRKVLGAQADFKTVSYTVSPNYQYPKEGGKPTITDYRASNIVRVEMEDLSLIGKVIDLATQTGANTIHRLQFALKDERIVQSQALREAAIKAKFQAEVLASALGLRIVRVLSVKENEPLSRPVKDSLMTARAEFSGAPTPVESGMIEVRATVTLAVEIGSQ